ncbi:Cysteine synthase K/M:Cysteine synthase B [Colletotrichum musicola]|uniref:Cysteine synthase K/M:Cysteine synthase B n=1 Tax=Colletotrichum musicola TaxID=2175873 RepID=A0A8H6K9K7_9PEZI|nr:Cysteine synthase K/M:Cysteine synthase B [Colletotrichum musicola]
MDNLNVFRGPESVANYFNPDNNPPLPLVEIPDRLNPYRKDGVRIYAKLLTALPAHNVKSLPAPPALGMLMNQPKAAHQAIAEASSGSTVLSLGIISRVLWGNEDVTAHVTNKKHPDSLKLLRFFGLKVSLYGGLAQQEPTDPLGIMQRLRDRSAEDDNLCYPGQYDNESNWKAHERWTGPQILKQLPDINIFCTTVGTGGCITGTGVYFKSEKPSVKVVGVFNVFGDPTPGPRHYHGFATCGFPWKGTVDEQREVASADAYRMSMKLSREGIIAGPSSGEALCGLLDYLGEMSSRGSLAELAEPSTGEVSCVFTCSDLPYQYLDGYYQKLSDDEFPPIENKILLSCDQDRHDERWILDPQGAVSMINETRGTSQETKELWEDSKSGVDPSKSLSGSTRPRRSVAQWIKACFLGVGASTRAGGVQTVAPDSLSSPLVIDLRSSRDFSRSHMPGAYNLSLDDSVPGANSGVDLFADAGAVHAAWSNLKTMFDTARATELIDRSRKANVPVLVVCYNGEVSRLATSVLRRKGVEAFSALGGFEALRRATAKGVSDV